MIGERKKPPTIEELDVSRNPTQRAFLECEKKYQLFKGGFGSGKTTACCAKVMLLSLQIPGNVGVVCRETYPDLRDTTRRAFFELLPGYDDAIGPESSPVVKQWLSAENRLVLRNGSEILFRYFDKGTIKVGANLGWFFIDQAEEATEDIFRALVGRLRRTVPKLYGLMAMNPNGEDWQHRLFVKDKGLVEKDFAYFESSSYENKANLPENYIEDMERLYSADWIDRFVHGKWTRMSGLIYHEFDDNVHMTDPFEIPNSWVKFRGNDWGIDAPSTCAFWAVKPGPVPIFYKFDEYEDREKTAEEHADAILLQSRPYGTFRASILDQSAFNKGSDLKSVADKYKAKGYQCLPATKDQMASILTVKHLLKSKRLFYFRGKTERTVEEMKAWKWAAKQQGKEVPARGNDHHLDSDRYALHWAWKKLFYGDGRPEDKGDRAGGRYHEAGKLSKVNMADICDPVTGLPA